MLLPMKPRFGWAAVSEPPRSAPAHQGSGLVHPWPAPAEFDPENANSGWAVVNPTPATARTVMPVRAKPAPVTFLSRAAPPFGHIPSMGSRNVSLPSCPYRNRLNIAAKLFLVGTEFSSPVEPVLLNHTFVPIPLALDAILRDIARLGIARDNRVLAFGYIVDRPIGREFYVLPYCKLVVRHVDSRTREVVTKPWLLRPVPR